MPCYLVGLLVQPPRAEHVHPPTSHRPPIPNRTFRREKKKKREKGKKERNSTNGKTRLACIASQYYTQQNKRRSSSPATSTGYFFPPLLSLVSNKPNSNPETVLFCHYYCYYYYFWSAHACSALLCCLLPVDSWLFESSDWSRVVRDRTHGSAKRYNSCRGETGFRGFAFFPPFFYFTLFLAPSFALITTGRISSAFNPDSLLSPFFLPSPPSPLRPSVIGLSTRAWTQAGLLK